MSSIRGRWNGAPWQRELLVLATVPAAGLVAMVTAASQSADDGRASTIAVTFAAFVAGAVFACARAFVLWRRGTLAAWDRRELLALLAQVRSAGSVRSLIGPVLAVAVAVFLYLVPGTPRTAALAALAGCTVSFGSFVVARHFLHYATLEEIDETLLH